MIVELFQVLVKGFGELGKYLCFFVLVVFQQYPQYEICVNQMVFSMHLTIFL